MNLLKGLVLVVEGVVQVFGIRAGVEQPSYETLLRDGPLELRQYAARVVAETVVTSDAEAARNTGFRRVAGYIFGDNQGGQQVAMTAPVAQARGEPIAMTAPVVQAPGAASGAWRIQFVMPAKYQDPEDLPRPNDPSVRIVREPAQRYAVVRFSGSRSAAATEAKTKQLLGLVAAHGWRPAGAPVAWFYDPPWTLPPARRNEVAVPVE
jgi:hypothetical protein